MMCEYCEFGGDNKDIIEKYYPLSISYVYIFGNCIWLESDQAGTSQELINYCPMCGRKLGEDE